MFSEIFIKRPVLATVLSLVILLAGLVALQALPVEQYPPIVPPQVAVTAYYDGASADVIAQSVAAPLEQSINGVDNMLYIQSSSASNGQLTLTVTFAIGTDPDQAAINVNNKVQSVLSLLPQPVRKIGVSVQKKSTAILQMVTLFSPSQRYDALFISNYALVNVLDELKRIPGVGDAGIFGAKDYSMRLWLRPDKMAQYRLVTGDIAQAVNEQNSQYAAGKVGAEPSTRHLDFTYTVTTQGRLLTRQAFEDIILRSNPDGSVIHVKDVARVELGARDYNFSARFDGQAAVPLAIYLSPGANQLEVAQQVQATMVRLARSFPDGLQYRIPYDTTTFVRVSIREVIKTLGEAIVLVFLVVYLFLQNWRATLIPCLAVPVSIVGTFAAMYLFGFSINTLTLFGMVLAIGMVVDDAIVVLENVERIMEQEALPPLAATIKAMREVTGPVVAIVLVLCAVFIPVAFLGGIAGQMYKQFAMTIASSVVISGLVALTLTPTLCVLLLRPGRAMPNALFRAFNRGFASLSTRYVRAALFLMWRPVLACGLFVLMLAAIFVLARTVPGSLVPNEDQGYVLAAARLPDGASLQRTQVVADQLDAITMRNPAVRDVVTMAGYDLLGSAYKTNAGVSFVTLKDWDMRTTPQTGVRAVLVDIYRRGQAVRDALILPFNPPPVTGMSNTGGFEAYIQSRAGASPAELEAQVRKLVAAAGKRPELSGVQTTYSANVPQIYLDLDREKTRALGVSISNVFDTMQSTFGALYVNDFNLYGRTFRVQLQSDADFRSAPDDIRNVYVRSQNNAMIPLAALITVRQRTGTETQDRFNLFPAAKIVGSPAPGHSSGEALAALEAAAGQVLPADFTLAWTGTAFQERSVQGTSGRVFGFGLIMVFLILAAQYEDWALPFSVLLAVPFAVFGAFVATWLGQLANDVYFQVALLTLTGLAAKNAILIVEFAVLKHEEGGSLAEAALAAARLRFRPIVMTSLAFILGCVPLAITHGAGAASRHTIGVAAIGGMLAATIVAILFIPLFFRLIVRGKGDAADRRQEVGHD
ncbi:efflux RND transporter permease subunit [Paludibacterium yongneupense]|uniref:efflux RND transporter permease subunit n=1 Tax=Paludibacterium yongneupense TaxID=400061 RepID=UPI000410679E|nr:multidrug efflux RND transporter permease subunit [Paludibacterium yongneupense]